tara:strand:+ start:2441 stop:3172 length:732 start_codon:yes stop_codon:yes gene_type:complete
MKLIFSRFGGKFKKSKEIISHFTNHKIYVECFLGSGAIFLNKDSSELSVLNDLDPLIYNIFKGAKENYEIFDNTEWDWKPNKEKWIQFKKDLSNGDTDLYKSIYIIYHSWSGLGSNFTATRWGDNYNYKRVLSDYIEKFKNTEIHKKDYLDIIDKYDSEDTLFYLDPPYDVALKKNYYEYQGGINFIEMRDKLKNIKGKFFLSLDITPLTTEIFKEFNLNEIIFKYDTRKHNKIVKEYLITNI